MKIFSVISLNFLFQNSSWKQSSLDSFGVPQGPDSAMWCVESRLLPLLLLADPIRNPVAALKEQSELTFQVKPEYK